MATHDGNYRILLPISFLQEQVKSGVFKQFHNRKVHFFVLKKGQDNINSSCKDSVCVLDLTLFGVEGNGSTGAVCRAAT